ncbi:MAG TPA: ClpXP protease specificity-enhancing factor [Gammaproteobacteria bacterium]|nr:ClpXP protease specificity-enhancing factor [Gammaproteobacteria bacterium]|tara:strand:+ start:1919 stop:2311 length:393 start_codon:yes stop_codon:yes gene_type:complete
MVSTRPYLIRAIHEWAVDNNLTPYILVDTAQGNVSVPDQLIEDNKIVLNIASAAVANLTLGDEHISFSARFAGVATEVFVPVAAVRAVYANENGVGIALPSDLGQGSASLDGSVPPNPRPPKGSHLKIIK